jgi:hypothetical protein
MLLVAGSDFFDNLWTKIFLYHKKSIFLAEILVFLLLLKNIVQETKGYLKVEKRFQCPGKLGQKSGFSWLEKYFLLLFQSLYRRK